MLSRRQYLRVKQGMLWLLVTLLTLFIVFPDLLLSLFLSAPVDSFKNLNGEVLFRVCTAVVTIVLTRLTAVAETVKRELTAPRGIDSLGIALPAADTLDSGAYAQPCHVVLIYDDMPSFKKGDHVKRSIVRSSILGNLKPISLTTKSQVEEFVREGRVLGIIADEKYYEEFSRYVSQTEIAFIGLRCGSTFSTSSSVRKLSLVVPDKSWDNACTHAVATLLSSLHNFDTPRGVGFHGNWFGTYGLMSLRQDQHGGVQGVYWYGKGKILNGTCIIDEENERLILEYSWTQQSNDASVGSSFKGTGRFLIPAGFEFFYGYWHDSDNNRSSQSWAAARVSRDLTEDVLGGGLYATDLGLSQHSLENIVRW